MTRLLQIPLDNGQHVFIEVANDSDEIVRSSRGEQIIESMADSLSGALKPFRALAETIVKTFQGLPGNPDEVTIEFSIKATATAGLVVAETSGEGSLMVALRWRDKSS